MKKRKSDNFNIKTSASAKAEVVAKVTYQRKRVTNEIIPEDVTRANAGAWLDLISPVTEWAGLKGDQLRYKRQLLRVQQDETLNRIAHLTRRRLKETGGTTNPVPTKFLVPFLERASLEDEDSELCKRWADLLASAATDYSPSMTRFSAVLSEIGVGEAQLLERMIRSPRGKRALNHVEDVPHIFLNGVINRYIDLHIEPQKTAEKLLEEILNGYEYPGVIWPFLAVENWDWSHDTWREKDEEMASNLVSLGVLHLVDGLEGKVGAFSWYGRLYALTSFSLRFLLACDISIKQELNRISDAFERRERDDKR